MPPPIVWMSKVAPGPSSVHPPRLAGGNGCNGDNGLVYKLYATTERTLLQSRSRQADPVETHCNISQCHLRLMGKSLINFLPCNSDRVADLQLEDSDGSPLVLDTQHEDVPNLQDQTGENLSYHCPSKRDHRGTFTPVRKPAFPPGFCPSKFQPGYMAPVALAGLLVSMLGGHTKV